MCLVSKGLNRKMQESSCVERREEEGPSCKRTGSGRRRKGAASLHRKAGLAFYPQSPAPLHHRPPPRPGRRGGAPPRLHHHSSAPPDTTTSCSSPALRRRLPLHRRTSEDDDLFFNPRCCSSLIPSAADLPQERRPEAALPQPLLLLFSNPSAADSAQVQNDLKPSIQRPSLLLLITKPTALHGLNPIDPLSPSLLLNKYMC